MYEQKDKPKKRRERVTHHDNTAKVTNRRKIGDDFFGRQSNGLQRPQVGLITSTYSNDFQRQLSILQRVTHDEKVSSNVVSTVAEVPGQRVDKVDSSTVDSVIKNAGGHTSTTQTENVVPNKDGSINPDLAKRLDVYKAWKADSAGNYSLARDRQNAYMRLVKEESPWPDGYMPQGNTLEVGTQFQMALSPGQAPNRPGGFGTFDFIPDTGYVRKELAVKYGWKPEIDRVVTYEVTKALPVLEGPVGPQADIGLGKYLPGGGSQIQMTVPPNQRMDYIRILDINVLK